MDGSPSVSKVYLRRETAVFGAFLQRRIKATHSHGSEFCAGRPETPFLDVWSTSSALYAPDEGLKDAEAASASFTPSSGA